MSDIDRLLTELRNDDEEVRRQAVKALADRGNSELLGHILEALGDPSWRVRKEAIEGIVNLKDPAAVFGLLPGLRDGANAGRRNSVVEALIRLGPAVIPHVKELLDDADADVRKFATDVLGGIDTPEVVPELIQALDDADENVVAAAAEYLGERSDLRALPALLGLLARESFWLRFCALRAIGQVADEEQENEVLPFLEDASLRAEAVDVLARIGGEHSFRRLLEWHSRGGGRERTHIMGALLDIIFRLCSRNAERGIDLVNAVEKAGVREEFEAFLAGRIRDPDHETRRRAVLVAGYLPSREIMAALIGVLEGAEEEQREEISRTLGRFPDDFMPEFFPFLVSGPTLVRRTVARMFGHRRYRPVLPRLLPLVKDEDGHVRSSVARALGHIGDTSAIMPLCELLGDGYPDVREAAAAGLTELVSQEPTARPMVVELLTTSLTAEKHEHAESALLVLGSLAEPSMVRLFGRFLKDASVKVRRAALAGLRELGGEESTEFVLTALTDENPDIRIEAIRALGQTGEEKGREAVTAMVDDENAMVSAEAVRSLGLFGGSEVRNILREIAEHGGGLKQLAAVQAFCAIGGAEERALLGSLLPSVSAEARREIAGFLGRTGDPAALPLLMPLLKDSEWGVRLATVEAIGRLGGADSIKALRDTYYREEDDPLVRRAMETIFRAGE